jgi:peptidoglycan/LPS O-acetylase OafA/YrhL
MTVIQSVYFPLSMAPVTASTPVRRLRKTSILSPLTTFRFFAALAIVFLHAFENDQHAYLGSGVSLFFVLSGFVLTYVHPRLDGLVAYARFWVARLGRIWPLHILTLVIVLIAQPFGRSPYKHFVVEFFLNTFLLQAWIPVRRVAMSFNFVSWSLSVELFFYLVFPFILPWVFRAPGKMIFASLAVYFLLVTGAILLHMPDGTSSNSMTFESFLFCPLLHLYEFVMGMAGAVWWMAAQKESKNFTLWSVIEILLFFGVLALIPSLNSMITFVLQGNPPYEMALQLGSLVRAPLFALLIYVFAFQAGLLSKIFSYRWLVYLGDISFSTYMIHCIILVMLGPKAESLLPFVKWGLLGVTILCASGLLYSFWEKPARAFVVSTAHRTVGT